MDSCLEWSSTIKCNSGEICSGGKCVDAETSNETPSAPNESSNEDTPSGSVPSIASKCGESDCEYQGECLSAGTRLGGEYCGVDGLIHNQKTKDGICEDNFECLSNACTDSKCTNPEFFTILYEWLRRLFRT